MELSKQEIPILLKLKKSSNQLVKDQAGTVSSGLVLWNENCCSN